MIFSFVYLFILLYFMPGLRGIPIVYYPLLLVSAFGFLLHFFGVKIHPKSISQLILILLTFFLVYLLPSSVEYPPFELVNAAIRISLVILLLLYISSSAERREKVLKLYVYSIALASLSIILQFIFGPFDFLLSEESSTRAGISRFASFAGSTTILGSAIPFAIIFTDYQPRIISPNSRYNYLNRVIQLLLLLVSVMTLSRSSVVLSIISFLVIIFRLYSNSIARIISAGRINLITKFKYKQFAVISLFTVSLILLFPRIEVFSKLITWFTVVMGLASNNALLERGMTTETNDLLSDAAQRLFWFKDNLFDNPLSLIFGNGTNQFGGVLGISESYAHNTFIDTFQAGGALGILLLSSIIILCIIKSIKQKDAIIHLGTIFVFVLLSLFNSGTLFHPLLIFPILYISCL